MQHVHITSHDHLYHRVGYLYHRGYLIGAFDMLQSRDGLNDAKKLADELTSKHHSKYYVLNAYDRYMITDNRPMGYLAVVYETSCVCNSCAPKIDVNNLNIDHNKIVDKSSTPSKWSEAHYDYMSRLNTVRTAIDNAGTFVVAIHALREHLHAEAKLCSTDKSKENIMTLAADIKKALDRYFKTLPTIED